MARDVRFFSLSKPKTSVDKEIILIVEGQDDAFFFEAMLAELGADPNIVGIHFIKGKDALEENLSLLKKTRRFNEKGIRKIAIIRDADEAGAHSLEAVQAALKTHALAAPDHAAFHVTTNSPEIGIFILPSANDEGDLEKLLLTTLGDDERLRLVIAFIDDVQERLGSLNHIYKRRALAYFAVSPTENRGVGWTYYNTDMFNHDHECLEGVRQFVRQLIS